MDVINRRDFLKLLGVVVGGTVLLPGCNNSEDTKPAEGFRMLTGDEVACLSAMCDQIIPPDDEWPGATEAGVLNYIDKQTSLRFPEDKAMYKNGVKSLQAYCNETFYTTFETLDEAMQYKVMQDMEAGRLPEEHWKDVNQRSFFNLIRNRTMQGFYGPPRHGGNKDYISYKMMRLDYPMVVGQNRYTQ